MSCNLTEIELDNGKKVMVLPELWKKYLTVPINPFTGKFHTKFFFDIDNNGLEEPIFNLVNDSLNSNIELEEYKCKDIFMDMDDNDKPKILIYLGVIRFIMTYLNVDIHIGTLEYYQIPKKVNELGWDDLDDLDVYVQNHNFYFMKKIVRLMRLVTMWIYGLLVHKNDQNICRCKAIINNIICCPEIDLCRKIPFEYHYIFEKNKKEIKEWKKELLITKPYLGIINGFGIECQSVIDKLLPPKIAPFVNHFFTKGIRDTYLNLNSLGIKFNYDSEKETYDVIRAFIINES